LKAKGVDVGWEHIVGLGITGGTRGEGTDGLAGSER